MSDSERPPGGRDPRVTSPTEQASEKKHPTGRQPRVSSPQQRTTGTHSRVTGSHPRVSGNQPRLSAGGPALAPPSARRTRRLIAMLSVGGGVALAAGGLLYAVYGDRDDYKEAEASASKSAPADNRAGAAPHARTAPPAAAGTPQPGQVSGQPATPVPPGAVAQAGAAASPTDAGAHGHARDGGVATAPEARRAATPAVASEKAKATARPDGGAPASKRDSHAQAASAPDGGAPSSSRRASSEPAARRQREDDDGSQVRVARFVEAGGADLEGRVVNIDTGRPVAGIGVDVRLEQRYVLVETGADGSFKAAGMVPGSKVLVWIGGRRDHMVAERFDVRIPENGKKADLGVVRLLDGDELDSRLDGWIGLYVTRKDGKVQVSAVNAWVPASRAGIEAGDSVISVDGREVNRLGPRSVSFLLRGPSGSSTTLEVEARDGTRRKLTLKRVTR